MPILLEAASVENGSPVQAARQVHAVYTAISPGDAAACAVLEKFIAAPQQQRAARFRAADDRHAYVAAHALERARRGGAAGETRTSLTHTRHLAAFAWGDGVPVGIDAEWRDPRADYRAVAGRMLAADEQRQILAAPPGRLPDLFLRFWTLKEAVAKALGQGLALPFERIVFSLDPLALVALPDNCGVPAEWQVEERAAGPSHHLALAVRHGGDAAVRVHWTAVSPAALARQQGRG
jgi:4'-phosphopantetheinyl transferase